MERLYWCVSCRCELEILSYCNLNLTILTNGLLYKIYLKCLSKMDYDKPIKNTHTHIYYFLPKHQLIVSIFFLSWTIVIDSAKSIEPYGVPYILSPSKLRTFSSCAFIYLLPCLDNHHNLIKLKYLFVTSTKMVTTLFSWCI